MSLTSSVAKTPRFCYTVPMTTKRLIRISYFTMLTIIGAMIRIPAGTVHFTLQTLFVVLAGFVLGRRDGAFAELAYMLLGLIGIPIFANGGGPQYVLQPSFGYIFAFFIGAYVAGFMINRFKVLKTRHIFISGMAALAPIYLIGMTYQVVSLMYIFSNLSFGAAMFSLINVCYMFLGDAAMILILSLLYPRIKTMIGQTKKQEFAENGLDGTAIPGDVSATVDTPVKKPPAMRP